MAEFHKGAAGELIVNDILKTLQNSQDANHDYELMLRP